MGLESLPATETLGDGYVRFQSHNSTDAQEQAPIDAMQDSTSSEELMEDCHSTVESCNGETPEEVCESALQVATMKRLGEKQFIQGDLNRNTDAQTYKNYLELGDNSKLLMCSELLSPWGKILSFPCVLPQSGHQWPLISHLKKPNQNGNPNSEGTVKGPDGRFYGDRLASTSLILTKEDWSPSLESKSYNVGKKGVKGSDNLEIQLEIADYDLSILEPSFSKEPGNQVEDIGADEKRFEESQGTLFNKEPWCGNCESAASLPTVIGSPKCIVDSNKTTNTTCYKKKLKLDAKVEHESDNLLKGRNAREWSRQGFEAQLLSGVSSNDDVDSVDMEVPAAVPLPLQFDSRNADSTVKSSAQLPAPWAILHQKESRSAEILQKDVMLSQLSKNSCVYLKMATKGTLKKPKLISSEPAKSIWSMKDPALKSEQQPCRSSRPLQLLDLEKKDSMQEGPHAMGTNHAQGVRLKQKKAIIHKKSRPFKSADVTSKKSVDPSTILEDSTQSCSITPIPAGSWGENIVFEFHEEVHNRLKQEQNKFLKQPKLNHDAIPNRTFHRAPQIGNRGKKLQTLSNIFESRSNNGLAHTDKQSKLNDTSNSQSQKLSRKTHQSTTENVACNLRADNSSGTLEVKACGRDSYITAARVKTMGQFDSEVKEPESVSHECPCLSGVSTERCDCIHHKYMVENSTLGLVLQEYKIKVVREAHRCPTPLLKDVLKANSRRLSTEFKEIEKLPDKYTESAVNDLQLKTVLHHIPDVQVENQGALGFSTAMENRDPALFVSNPITDVAKRAGPFRCMIDGGPQNEGINGFSSKALNFSEKQDGCWWEGDYSSSLPCNNLRFTLHEDFSSPPSGKAQQQRTSVDPADICETLSDSTCTEDSEQPSPVSVIDSYFQKKLLLRLQKDSQQQLHESHMKRIELIEASSALSTSEFPKEDKCDDIRKTDAIHYEQIMEADLATSESDCCSICLVQHTENAEKMVGHYDMKHYVKRVLIALGFQLENKKWPLQCSSRGLMNNPELFQRLENQQHIHGAIKTSDCNPPKDAAYALRLYQRCRNVRTHYRLLFDCVNEALDLSLSDEVFSHGQGHRSHLDAKLRGEHILDQICKHMSEWQNLRLEAVDRVVDIEMSGTDKDWRNFRQELADVAIITECMVFRDVIEEILLDFMGLKK
ncbi:hypothetical protein O6H91_06G088800 [Diphasiastrum complanatum]|nr:hypothetical protein O6H91_06G088800 [Diphasiastrum complanatum]